MVTRVIEIGEDGHHLSKYRGFMLVKRDSVEVGRVPLDDMTVVILSAHQITLSKSLLSELAARHIPLMTCGKNFHPHAFSLPYAVHYDQTGVLWMQIEASKPLQKRLWQSVVEQKIINQRLVLDYFNPDHKAVKELEILSRRVKSGDPENIEAQAARQYWPALMGDDFRRDRAQVGENSFLNYGYSIVRAATARAVCGAGLTPALGIHHRNRKNAYALVDDMMEPFRPVVDLHVRQILDAGGNALESLTPAMKKDLVKVLDLDVQVEKGITSVMNSMHRLAHTLVQSLQAGENKLEFPKFKARGVLI